MSVASRRPEDALVDFTLGIESKPDNSNLFPIWAILLQLRGQTYLRLGRQEDAVADFTQAIEAYPSYVNIREERANAYMTLQRYECAVDDYTAALEMDADNTKILGMRGIAYRQMGRFEEAVADFSRAVVLNPATIAAVSSDYGLVLTYLGRYAEAIAIYEQGLKADPNSAYLLYDIAVAKVRHLGLHHAQHDIEKAREVLTKLVESDRGSGLYGLAGLQALEGKTDQAFADLKQAMLLNAQCAGWARHDTAWLDLHSDERFRFE